MSRLGFTRRRKAPSLTALCGALLLLAGFPGTASAAVAPDPSSNYPEQIPPVCSTAPQSAQCTQAGIVELDAARASEDQPPYQLPADFLSLSGAHQIVVLANLDRQANGLRAAPGTTAALNRAAMAGAEAWTDPVVKNPTLSWAANWAGDFPAAVWAYLTWMYDDGYPGPNVDCPTPGAHGCWGHRHDILARFSPGGTLEMGAADLNDNSYALIIAQSQQSMSVRDTYRSPARRAAP
ncbi:MAG TPA: hypothetical protein VMF07_22035 [Solirubrobacteraceae bacterium]|nr:hypothetical protein [Solirubrobacteraceae bacterium]